MNKWNKISAIEDYAQYWWRETPNAMPFGHSPVKHPYRTVFSCDRDRVMYCSAFRRLSSKTQIFITSASDSLRTRLTHTLEVAQIARAISEQLGLNVDLTEAIALGHDLGHTPFGHVGERTIHRFSIGADKKQKEENIVVDNNLYGFKHNLQSVRILTEYSENVKFSNFMLYGVREHSKRWWNNKEDVAFYSIYDSYCSCQVDKELYSAWSFEAFVVKWADEIAQRHHDLEDAYLQKIMKPDDIVDKLMPIVRIINNSEHITQKYIRLKDEAQRIHRRSSYPIVSFSHTLSSFLVDAYVTIIIKEFERVFKHICNEYAINTHDDFKRKYFSIDEEHIRTLMSLENTSLKKADFELGKTLKNSILDSFEVQKMDGKGSFVIRKLLRAYISNPQQLPDDFINRLIKVELKRNLCVEDYNMFINRVLHEISDISNNVDIWRVYECRQALRILKDDDILSHKTYAILVRVVFDYVAGMTDTYALKQYGELY